eukprot:CAMPEP_0117458278 /NCGR_PEP_ID=MMETSP0784-20121206/846_1 /TAXON_ID=39447 /ORGANISM="" /LENGTH=190 /DNA_ID=CAMNT_0005251787 /DNA_START=411 /DNA_END=983 /DNA_ORIENTATION=-
MWVAAFFLGVPLGPAVVPIHPPDGVCACHLCRRLVEVAWWLAADAAIRRRVVELLVLVESTVAVEECPGELVLPRLAEEAPAVKLVCRARPAILRTTLLLSVPPSRAIVLVRPGRRVDACIWVQNRRNGFPFCKIFQRLDLGWRAPAWGLAPAAAAAVAAASAAFTALVAAALVCQVVVCGFGDVVMSKR